LVGLFTSLSPYCKESLVFRFRGYETNQDKELRDAFPKTENEFGIGLILLREMSLDGVFAPYGLISFQKGFRIA
jgi:hypothetical protein